MHPGVDLDLLDGWINDRYAAILDRMAWQRLEVRSTFQTTAEYATGTVSVTAGSTALVGTGTTWTSAMTGAMFRVGSDNAYYEFAYVSATSGTLNRAYEGTTDALAAYRLNRNVYGMPADLRSLVSVESFETGLPLKKLSLAEMNALFPTRSLYGSPLYWCPYMDAQSDPPAPQIELYPIPEAAQGFPYHYIADPSVSDTLLPWLRPSALIAGVRADICMSAGVHFNAAMAQLFETQFERAVMELVGMEMRRAGPVKIEMPSRHTAHRARRWTR